MIGRLAFASVLAALGAAPSVRLVQARFRLIVTIRPKYACKEPAAILQAPAPEHIVEAGQPT